MTLTAHQVGLCWCPPPPRLYFKDKNKCFPSSFRNVKLCRVPFLLTVMCRQPHCTYCCEDELCGTLSHASARSNKFRLRPQCARRGLWAGSQAWQWKSSLQQFAGKPTARVPPGWGLPCRLLASHRVHTGSSWGPEGLLPVELPPCRGTWLWVQLSPPT